MGDKGAKGEEGEKCEEGKKREEGKRQKIPHKLRAPCEEMSVLRGFGRAHAFREAVSSEFLHLSNPKNHIIL